MKSLTGLLIACIIGWIFYSGTSCTILHAQTITSDLQHGRVACPDSEVVFTCVTRGSAAIAWQSDFYVGDQIGFLDGRHQEGDTSDSSSNPNTVATLTRSEVDNGVRVLQSTLRIVASLNSPHHSVTCVHADSGNTSSFSFQVLADPSMPQQMISNQTMDDRERCVLHLAWSSPSNIAVEHVMTYMIKIDGNNSVNKTNSDNSTWNLFAHSLCSCGSHTVSISTVNICHRVGPSTPDVTLHPKLLLTCPARDINIAYVTTASPKPPTCDGIPIECFTHLIVIIVVLAVFSVLGMITTIVFAILWRTGTLPPNGKASVVNQRTEGETKVKDETNTTKM